MQESVRDRGATVLVVTHDHRLEGYADRVFTMADGSLKPDGPAAATVEMAALSDTAVHTPRLRSDRATLSCYRSCLPGSAWPPCASSSG